MYQSGYLFGLLVSISLCFHYVTTYGVGAPDMACVDMIPRHGPSPQSSSAPFGLVLSSNETSGGQRISLRLGGGVFKGFLIQGRRVSNGDPVGTFVTNRHNLLSCGNGVSNAVTHTNSAELNNLEIEWEAPSDLQEMIQFRATVVQDYNTFWTGVTSQEIAVKKRSVGGATSGDSPPPSRDPSPRQEDMNIKPYLSSIYEGCGSTKTCIGSPGGCESKKNCDFMVTFTSAGNGMYEFELKGKGGFNKYVSAALSSDNRMGDDSVMVCGSTSNGVEIFMTWNNGRSNENVLKPTEGILPILSGDLDGDMYCRFQRREVTTPKNNFKFDLKNDKFHILAAQGSMTEDKNLRYHSTDRIFSPRPLSLSVTSKVKVRDSRFFKMIHGCLMIGAWVCAASTGILLARYFKQTWLSYRCCNIDQWFHLHRFFMVLTWAATIVACVLIVYELNDFRVSYHSIIGAVSIGLCFIQPFMAALRPHPQSKNRAVFNWLHWFVGNGAQILGIAAIFLGYELFIGEERRWTKEIAWAILVAFIAFHCLCHLFLSIAQCCSDRRPKPADVFPLKEFAGSRTLLQGENARMDAPFGCFRKFILGLYLPVNWILTAILMVLVIFKQEEIEDQLIKWEVPPFWEHL